MSKILELREKRAKAWEAAKAFLDAKRTQEGFVSVEDAATYDKMENDVVNLGKEIERLERQAAIDAELSKATSTPITNKPDAKTGGDTKTGRATDEYRKAFWNGMRNKVLSYEVQNALTIGTDSEGGYLVPDEYEKKLVEALEEEVFFRNLATVIKTSSGDRKIPIVTSKSDDQNNPPLPRTHILSGHAIAYPIPYDGEISFLLRHNNPHKRYTDTLSSSTGSNRRRKV